MRFNARSRSWPLALAVAAGLVFGESRVSAAPIEASASAADASGERARAQAISAARRGALEQALAAIEIAKDDAAVAEVLARADAWTAAYRVLEVVDASAGVEVRVEVEIDLPRLRKRVAKLDAAARPRGFVFASHTARGCAAVDEAALSVPLRAYGIVGDAGDASLSLAISCQDRGAVMHTHVQAASVEIVATVVGGAQLEARAGAQGFAMDTDSAMAVALDRALGELADELAVAARGALELHVEQPWPAARVTTLERTLRQSVIGVDTVELAGIAADGSAILRIGGGVETKAFAQALQDLSFPGFALVGLRVDGAHALRVRMQ